MSRRPRWVLVANRRIVDAVHVFLAAAALGFVLNVAPGPVLAETVSRGVRGGFRSALAVQLGSLVWSFLCAAFVERLFRGSSARITRITYQACAIAFLVLAVSAARDVWMGHGRHRGPSLYERLESR